MATWQVQQAKSRLKEVIDRAVNEGPQTITKHGTETAVVLSAAEYRRLASQKKSFIEHLLSGPEFELDLPRRETDPPRDLELWDETEGREEGA